MNAVAKISGLAKLAGLLKTEVCKIYQNTHTHTQLMNAVANISGLEKLAGLLNTHTQTHAHIYIFVILPTYER